MKFLLTIPSFFMNIVYSRLTVPYYSLFSIPDSEWYILYFQPTSPFSLLTIPNSLFSLQY